ncbi:hypothetical protein LTR86_004203 [Recurvomyces mirabilis]|nr:hypothetical protein LTR86_004203 [Recurvomyces mirabilis]
MPASAAQTKTWFRPKGWFTDHELGITVNRILRDDPSKGDMHNRMGITPARLWNSICDYDLWILYIIGLLVYIPQNPPNTYLTLSLRQLGFSTLHTNLLAIPSEIVSCFTLLGVTWLSVHVKERSLVSMLQNIWLLPCLLALRLWPGANHNAWSTYGLITTLLSYPYCHAIVVSWASRNSGSVRTRSVSAAFYNMTVQLGNIIASNIYRADDKPLYHRGNTVLICIDVVAILLFLVAKMYYIYRNRSRAARWESMTEEETAHYLDATTDEGNKRLDFRFDH